MEVSQAARWPSAQGVVIASTTEAREVKSGGADSGRHGAAHLRQDRLRVHRRRPQIPGRAAFRSARTSGNFEVAETTRQISRAARTSPSITTRASPPRRCWSATCRPASCKAIIIIVLVLVGLIVGGWCRFQQARRPHGDDWCAIRATAPFVTACIGFALLAALVDLGHPAQRGAAALMADGAGPDRKVRRARIPGTWTTRQRAGLAHHLSRRDRLRL